MNNSSQSSSSQKKYFGANLPFFYGWVVVAVAFVTMGIGVNARTSFSLLFPPILEEFGWARGTIAATFSIGFMVSTVISPFIGALMDRFGPRLVLPLGGVLSAIGLVLATFATDPWHFFVTLGVLVVGGSVFMSYIGHTLFLPNWFDRRRGLALGLAFAGAGVGAMVLFPWMQHAIQTQGWRFACIVIALVLLIFLVPLNILLQRHRPKDLGLEIDGGQMNDSAAGKARQDELNRRIVNREWIETDWTPVKAMRTGRFWWLILAFVTSLYAWSAVQGHQTRYLIDVGISAEVAAVALGLVGLTGVFGQIAVGALSDRIGRELAWSLALMGFLLTYACLFLLREWPSEWLMYVMVGLQGLIGYGMASIFGAVPAELFSGKRYGAIFGFIGSFSSTGAAIGPWVTGVLFDVAGNYETAFIVAMILCGISITAMWIASPRKVILVAGRARKS